MGNKRIYQLTDAGAITGRYLPVDKSGNSEAERYLLTDLIDYIVASAINSILRNKTVAVTAGANSITFTTAITGAYTLITKLVLADGSLSGGEITNETSSGFDFNAYDDGNLTYWALIEK